MLAEAAAGLGHVASPSTAMASRATTISPLPFSGDFVPSLPVRIAAAYLGLPWSKVGLALGDGVQLGDRLVPTDPAMRLVVNYRGPRGTIPTFSFADLVEGRLAADLFKGRIVLIGASVIGIANSYSGPFGNTPIPGTERLANIVDTILAGDFIRENPPPWPSIVIGAGGGFGDRDRARGGAAADPARGARRGGADPRLGRRRPDRLRARAVAAARQPGRRPRGGNRWRAAVPLRASSTGRGASFNRRSGSTSRPTWSMRWRRIPSRLQLGGETRMLSVMFSDIRGFTAISEQFKANPQGLSRLINRGFLSPMTKLIMARRGTIDKYMGDCVMAFWNAPLDDPDHADHACASALAMLAELDRINRELAAEAEAEDRPFHTIHIGVGINTGECVVGNMGSDERFAYTAMGDAVNLASRLEGQSKTYGVSIVIGEATREAAPSWAALELDLIAVNRQAGGGAGLYAARRCGLCRDARLHRAGRTARRDARALPGTGLDTGAGRPVPMPRPRSPARAALRSLRRAPRLFHRESAGTRLGRCVCGADKIRRITTKTRKTRRIRKQFCHCEQSEAISTLDPSRLLRRCAPRNGDYPGVDTMSEKRYILRHENAHDILPIGRSVPDRR